MLGGLLRDTLSSSHHGHERLKNQKSIFILKGKPLYFKMDRGTKNLWVCAPHSQAHCTNAHRAPATERQVPVDESVTVLGLSLPTHRLIASLLSHPMPHPT